MGVTRASAVLTCCWKLSHSCGPVGLRALSAPQVSHRGRAAGICRSDGVLWREALPRKGDRRQSGGRARAPGEQDVVLSLADPPGPADSHSTQRVGVTGTEKLSENGSFRKTRRDNGTVLGDS